MLKKLLALFIAVGLLAGVTGCPDDKGKAVKDKAGKAISKGKDDLNRDGFFAAPTRGLEVAVKDSRRFDGGWGYYMYHETADSQLGKDAESSLELAPTAEKPFPQRDCFDCHSEHGAVDNVFTQFYSVLTTARQKHLQRKSRSGKQ